MSAISTIFDAMNTVVSTALPTHAELINPYFPETDSEFAHGKSFGVALAEGTNLLGNEGSGVEQRQRVFIVTITRRKFATKANITERKSTEKLLLEDWTLVMDAIAQDQTLGSAVVQRAIYLNDSGIEFLRTDRNRNDILLLRSFIQVDYDQTVQLCT